MNKQKISELKAKVKRHAPEIAMYAALALTVGTTVVLRKKTPQHDVPDITDASLGDIVVLQHVSDDIYTDLDWPGMMYSVNIVS